jgi:hypothetical protein
MAKQAINNHNSLVTYFYTCLQLLLCQTTTLLLLVCYYPVGDSFLPIPKYQENSFKNILSVLPLNDQLFLPNAYLCGKNLVPD